MRRRLLLLACIATMGSLGSPAVANETFPFTASVRTTCTARMLAPTVEFARWQVTADGVHLEFATAGARIWRLSLNNPNAAKANSIVFTDGAAGAPAAGETGEPAPPVQVSCLPSR